MDPHDPQRNPSPGGQRPSGAGRPNPGQSGPAHSGPGPSGPGPRPSGSRWIFWLILGLLLYFLFFNPFGSRAPAVPYSTFKQQVQQNNVSVVHWKGQQIQGTFRQPVQLPASAGGAAAPHALVPGTTAPPGGASGGSGQSSGSSNGASSSPGSRSGGGSGATGSGATGPTVTQFITYVPSSGDPTLIPLLQKHDVTIDTQPPGNGSLWVTLLVTGLPILLLVLGGLWLLRRVGGQGGAGQSIFSVGKSKAKLFDREKVSVSFDDVAGTEGAKAELQETVTYLKSPERFLRLGGRTPSGVLLVGPPGTGKTLLARAVAGEAGVPFFSTSGSDFVEMFVGVGASRVRDMFQEARKHQPAILFIDELDSVGRKRGAGLGGGNDEREQTLNQLLSEMDGFEPHESVVVMAATNRPDVLDTALMRPGRFDKQVTVDLPTRNARLEILRIHARGKPLADDVDLDELARGTPGMSGADLENLLNEAALHAAQTDKSVIERVDVEAARDQIFLGRERVGLTLTEDDKQMIAYHEGGHAVVAATLEHADPVSKVTIVPRGRAMGVTQQLPERDRYVVPKEYLLDRLAVMMGGRAAERLVLGTSTSGAAADLQQASQLARRMVKELGMVDALGPVSFKQHEGQVFLGEELREPRSYSEETGREIDRAVRDLLEEAFERATQALVRHRYALDELARTLVEHEEVDGSAVTRVLERGEPQTAAD
ncbi:MAG: ATP-dependent zinc metalloprotease FtsH [Deinococcales bacterium]